MNKVYLPNLNSLRAIAACMVIISHLLNNKTKLGQHLGHFGGLGVTIFFTLSGFLITYLLLAEQEKFKTIKVKDFYIRRALRIWPLYFLVLLFTYILIPFIIPSYYQKEINRFNFNSVLLNIFFLTNVTLILKMTPLIIRVIWSIGIEEQFYIFWPWVIKLKQKWRNKIIFLIILAIPALKFLFMALNKFTSIELYQTISSILSVTRFDAMAVGGLFGILGYSKELKVLKFTFKLENFFGKNMQLLVFGLAFFSIIITSYSSDFFNIVNFLINPWLFGFCILNLSINKAPLFNIENKTMNYLGKISFGLYLIHQIVIYFLLYYLVPYLKEFNPIIKDITMFIATFSLTILIAHLSYTTYEKRFINLKSKFSYIKT